MEPRFGLVADSIEGPQSIDGPAVRVRRYRDDDVPDVQAGCDDPLTQLFLPLLPTPYTRSDAQWWVDEGAGVAFDNGGGNYVIAGRDSDRLLGGIGITHLRDGNGEIGYWVAPWGRRRGVATAATRTLSEYAFSTGYGRLHLRTQHENTSSQRVAIGAGYRYEGLQRAAGLTRSGTRHDLLVWSRLATDPPGPVPRALPDLRDNRLTDGRVTLAPLGPDDPMRPRRDVWTWTASSDPDAVPTRAPADWLTGSAARVTIRDNATGVLIGDAVLDHHLPSAGIGAIGYAVAPARDDLTVRALRLLVRWALHDVGLTRLTAGTAPDDRTAHDVLERAGFRREGYLRGARTTKCDTVLYALVADDLKSAG
jgi:RimJ/RimL family protein N-acetyltransferase